MIGNANIGVFRLHQGRPRGTPPLLRLMAEPSESIGCRAQVLRRGHGMLGWAPSPLLVLTVSPPTLLLSTTRTPPDGGSLFQFDHFTGRTLLLARWLLTPFPLRVWPPPVARSGEVRCGSSSCTLPAPVPAASAPCTPSAAAPVTRCTGAASDTDHPPGVAYPSPSPPTTCSCSTTTNSCRSSPQRSSSAPSSPLSPSPSLLLPLPLAHPSRLPLPPPPRLMSLRCARSASVGRSTVCCCPARTWRCA